MRLLVAGIRAPWFTGTGDLFHLEICNWIHRQLVQSRISHAKDVGWGAHHGSGLYLLHFQYPGLRVQDTAGHSFAADLFAGIMACPEGHKDIVAERKKDPIMRAIALSPKQRGPAFRPPFPILPSVGLIHRLAGGAAGLPEFGYLVQGYTQGIPVRKRVLSLYVPQHGLFHFGDQPHVRHGPDVIRLQPCILIEGTMKPGSVIGPLEDAAEFL